ncbi:PREDICTED: putative SWI/SNF-related matrix-associated actin-dependent regulator of chromatin subfamily A member 3-like 2 [Lupinus angustifolius]|uniref:putative SWI/SNF-related matrix-associated actin-dependent regulator of chromatin subfamily A member 3-like 2 n=1 Tax=Lupinus angustifolius TaxID=3871 RepID=UPI00092E6CC9|nr:PREDICTED: putative SWI/SNF-related matrix-associated actin-dependent regulator of chromatin subfamily A member 3-like 2 [Lupinus angustifolius]
MSRGDTQEFVDLNKLAERFLRGTYNASDGEVKDAPSCAYVQEVVEELRKGEQGECPICLEAFEDAVLTPCAHRLCRDAYWQVGEMLLLVYVLFVGKQSADRILSLLLLIVDLRLILKRTR